MHARKKRIIYFLEAFSISIRPHPSRLRPVLFGGLAAQSAHNDCRSFSFVFLLFFENHYIFVSPFNNLWSSVSLLRAARACADRSMPLNGKSTLWSEIFSQRNVHERMPTRQTKKKKRKRHRCAKES
jgi:hypothetical protein